MGYTIQSNKMLKDIESALFLTQVFLKLYGNNENFVQEEIKSRFSTENACQCSVQNLVSTYLLSKTYRLKFAEL